ncbi:PREDICTED: protein POLYCHOME-like [Tarenaya hassleriana]|uniref:protein POLYCHOME-like n=1 Tax=Tarenaya hassleriana TaxID=28532 RepID=UPI00053C1C58|nr:PREDICTED: protein POLYCHOME-like [Tarenaya hassleriana]
MAESRDRLDRPVDFSAAFLSRRQNGILLNESASRLVMSESPVQRSPFGTAGSTALRPTGSRPLVRRGGFARRLGNRRGLTPFRLPHGRENTPVGAARHRRGRVSTSVLPSWYPRTPLRDITAIVRAIERRRASMRGVDGRELETPTPQRVGDLDSPLPQSGAQLEHNSSMVTPAPAMGLKRSCPTPSTAHNVHKILLEITNEHCGEAEFLTPEKKVLNSIDKVEKVVMEEIQKLNSTPTAKRAEREKRVRTLMSMR